MPRHTVDLAGARRQALLLAALALSLVLGWDRGALPPIPMSTRLLEPPTPAEMRRAGVHEEVSYGSIVVAQEAPVTLPRMALWFALPLVTTTLLVFLTARRR
ncbi:MAG: hypothetical protein ACJ8AO_12150 [Gemmatimonadaceae bacterium]